MPILNSVASALGLPLSAFAWCLFDISQWGFMSVSFHFFTPLLFKSSMVQLGWSMPSPAAWSLILAIGTTLGTVFSPLIGAVADQSSRRKMFLVTILVALIVLNMLFIFTISYSTYVAVAAIVVCLVLYSCSSSLYNSLVVCFCDRETMQRSFFISTILSNAFSCMLLLVIALILGGQNPTIGFTRDTYIFSALLSLAFAYPLWLYVPEPEGDTLAEPITLSTSVTAVINGAQALAKNRELLKFAAASFILQDGMMCLYHISLIYGAHVGISDGNLIVGQVVNRLVGAISAVFWLPFSQRFGTRASYFVSISIGVAASCVILLPMTAHLFWFLSALLALTGTGNFIFARVLLSELTSVQHASVTYGLASGISNMSGILGPAVYAFVAGITHSAHTGLFTVLTFVVLGFFLMTRVDFSTGYLAATSQALNEPDEEEEDVHSGTNKQLK